MRYRTLSVLSIALAMPLHSCKKAENEGANSSVNADAAAVASGQELLLTRDSVPEPQIPPKATKADFKGENFELAEKSFPREEVARYQIAGSDLTGTPRALQGIWWMDGNPLGDETVSFAKVDFSLPDPLLTVFGHNNFSFHAGAVDSTLKDPSTLDGEDKAGALTFNAAAEVSLAYELHFEKDGKDYERGYIVPTIVLPHSLISKRFRLSKDVFEFTFIKKSENVYERGHKAGGNELGIGYSFRRILIPSAKDPSVLEKTEYWDLYALQKSPVRLRLAQKK